MGVNIMGTIKAAQLVCVQMMIMMILLQNCGLDLPPVRVFRHGDDHVVRMHFTTRNPADRLLDVSRQHS